MRSMALFDAAGAVRRLEMLSWIPSPACNKGPNLVLDFLHDRYSTKCWKAMLQSHSSFPGRNESTRSRFESPGIGEWGQSTPVTVFEKEWMHVATFDRQKSSDGQPISRSRYQASPLHLARSYSRLFSVGTPARQIWGDNPLKEC